MSGTWSSGWISGDVVTAAEFKKGAGMIADSTLSGAAASIDFTGLPTSYAHLAIFLNLKDTAGAAGQLIAGIRFNNDSGANYDTQFGTSTAAGDAHGETFAQTSGRACIYPGTSGTSGGAWLTIPNYAATVFEKTWESSSFSKVGTTTGLLRRDSLGGGWRSTAAINRVTIISGSTSFAIGSRITVYAFGS